MWNQTRKRNPWGQVKATARAEAEWLTVSAPELRVVSDELWVALHERLTDTRRAYLRGTKGQLWGRPERSAESKYLLTGLARCATCNGSLYVKSRSHGKRRQYFYGCTSFHLRGSSVCANSVEVPIERSDDAVLSAIERDALQPQVVGEAIRKAMKRLTPQVAVSATADREAAGKQLAGIERDLERLTAAITAGGELQTLVQAIHDRETERNTLRRKIAALEAVGRASAFDPQTVERQLRAKLEDWRGLLRRHVPQARQVLRKLLIGPIAFKAYRTGRSRGYEFSAPIGLGRILTGLACANMVASPTGFEPYPRTDFRLVFPAA